METTNAKKVDDVGMIPPDGNPEGGQIYNLLPLFSRQAPDSPPVAFLTSLKFQMGSYLTPEQMATGR